MNRRFASTTSSSRLLGVAFVVVLLLLVASVVERKQLEAELQNAKFIAKVYPLAPSDDEIRFPRRILSIDEPYIFVGGVPRSGTTLMRAMLDAHSLIRCGGETMMLPQFLQWQSGWRGDKWMNGSGITPEVLDLAVSAFISEIVAKHDKMAERLCNKDPYTALWLPTLRRLFPNARFILMIRDARAVVHSMVEREVPVGGYNRSDPPQMFRKWNQEITKMLFQCGNAPGLCLQVFYERLVQKPREEIGRILEFLDVPFDENVLRHHQLIGDEIDLSDQEFSASQVKKALNVDALTAWFDCFSNETLAEVNDLAPMLSLLGYDTKSTTPSYERFAGDDFHRGHF
ncbi:unnamed protein product [Caenorhabditis auriculariae]|uniref:Protein-tyrosine sulfotransferase n=1 Tax=Caenorhabditis auriculariae TaxID=2777116 RepID=A0A8S1H4U2_9PELO|nr:unnamed protein product [Caenorhabditis auriculariae]